MGALGRVELPTNGLGNRCSIHLSYRAARCGNYRMLESAQAAPSVSGGGAADPRRRGA